MASHGQIFRLNKFHFISWNRHTRELTLTRSVLLLELLTSVDVFWPALWKVWKWTALLWSGGTTCIMSRSTTGLRRGTRISPFTCRLASGTVVGLLCPSVLHCGVDQQKTLGKSLCYLLSNRSQENCPTFQSLREISIIIIISLSFSLWLDVLIIIIIVLVFWLSWKTERWKICILQVWLFSFLHILDVHFKLSIQCHKEWRKWARFLQTATSDWLLRCLTVSLVVCGGHLAMYWTMDKLPLY